MDTTDKGFLGEEIATQFLLKNHYQILQRNYRKKWGELDIVAFDKKTKETVFIEVKMITSCFSSILPEEELTREKIEKLKRTILSFLSQYHLEEKPWRFDFLAIENLTNSKNPLIRHYKDVYLEF